MSNYSSQGIGQVVLQSLPWFSDMHMLVKVGELMTLVRVNVHCASVHSWSGKIPLNYF